MARWFIPIGALVRSSDIDIVLVCTTHDALSAIGAAALLAGKAVLVEKPAGRNPAGLEKIARRGEEDARFPARWIQPPVSSRVSKIERTDDGGKTGGRCFISARATGMADVWAMKKNGAPIPN